MISKVIHSFLDRGTDGWTRFRNVLSKTFLMIGRYMDNITRSPNGKISWRRGKQYSYLLRYTGGGGVGGGWGVGKTNRVQEIFMKCCTCSYKPFMTSCSKLVTLAQICSLYWEGITEPIFGV